MKKKLTEEEEKQQLLDAHYAAIEYMKNMDRPRLVRPISKTRRILRIGLLLIIRFMQVIHPVATHKT